MPEYKLAEMESQFADLIWELEPVNSTVLVQLCAERLGWKKSTTYTVLKKLCARGIFKNENATVTALLTREEFYTEKGRQLVEKAFNGSLSRFLTAFIGRQELSGRQIEELKELIENYKEGS